MQGRYVSRRPLLRPEVVTTTGTDTQQPAQNQITTYGFDWMGHLKSVEQHYTADTGFTSGTSTLVTRDYDGYGHITSEKVFVDGTNSVMNQFNQTWDAAGNRTSLASQLTPQGSGAGLSTSYTYWADGLLQQETVAGGNSYNFAYDTNGLLTSRSNPWRTQSVTSRDTLGRLLTRQSTLSSGTTPLSESQTWNGRAMRASYTANRSGTGVWNETRNYYYNGRGQINRETDAPTAGGYADNHYGFDHDTTGSGLGVRAYQRRCNSVDSTTWDPGSYYTYSSGTSQYSTTTTNGLDQFWRPTAELAALADSSIHWSPWTYDATGQSIWHTYWPIDTQRRQHSFTWDALGRMVQVQDRDYYASTFNGYIWTAIYDGLGRRLRTVKQPITGGTNSGAAQTIDSYYDPQVEFLELGVSVNGARTWKVQGPDLNGRYGALQGIGGLEATIDEASGTVTPVVNDVFGNVVGWINGGAMVWNTERVGSYGLLPGSTAPVFGESGVTLAQSQLWRSRRIDPTGYYYLGARYYEPNSGRFLSPDPLGHAASMSLYDYCNGDPVNGLDPDGRCSNSSWSDRASGQIYGYGKTATDTSIPFQYKEDPVNWGQVGDQIWNAAHSTPGVGTVMNMAESVATHFYQGMTGTDINTGQAISGWNQVQNAALFTLDIVPMMGEVKLGTGALKSLASVETAAAESELVHITDGAHGALINKSGVLQGNIYAGPLSNASQSGLGITARTGIASDAFQAAVRVPAAGEAAFSKVIPIGPITAWQRFYGQQYTANGVLNLTTGAFSRTGVNWNQAAFYGIDAATTATGVGLGIYYLNRDE